MDLSRNRFFCFGDGNFYALSKLGLSVQKMSKNQLILGLALFISRSSESSFKIKKLPGSHQEKLSLLKIDILNAQSYMLK